MAAQDSESFTITGTTSYPGTAQVQQSIVPTQLVLQNRGDATIYFSFNGSTDDGQLIEGESLTLTPEQGWLYRTIYLREGGDGSSGAIVRVSFYA